MKKSTAILGLAALAGIGYLVGKKVAEKKCQEVYDDEAENDDEESSYCCESKYDNKLHKASMFAVGAIKTGADKVAEGISDIINKDNKEYIVKKGEDTFEQAKESVEQAKESIVKKSEETFEQAKEATENIKKEIGELKNLAVSINKDDSEETDVSESAEESSDTEESNEDASPVTTEESDKISDIDFAFGEVTPEDEDDMDTI